MEQEIKIRVAGFAGVKKRLAHLGARHLQSTVQLDRYYANTRLFSRKGRSFVLRVRESSKGTFLTYKSNTAHIGVWDEYEMGINKKDSQKMCTILGFSGFERFLVLRKSRSMYKYSGATINLDVIDGLGKFVEIEIISKSLSEVKLRKIAKDLQLDLSDSTRVGYVDLLFAKKRSRRERLVLKYLETR